MQPAGVSGLSPAPPRPVVSVLRVPSTWTPRLFSFCFSFFRACHTGPPKGRAPPPRPMLCVRACEVCVHGDVLALILHVSGRIHLPTGQGPRIGLPWARPGAPCGFLVTWPAAPPPPTVERAPVSRSHAAWVVLPGTPALGAEAATLSDRWSAEPGQRPAVALGRTRCHQGWGGAVPVAVFVKCLERPVGTSKASPTSVPGVLWSRIPCVLAVP